MIRRRWPFFVGSDRLALGGLFVVETKNKWYALFVGRGWRRSYCSVLRPPRLGHLFVKPRHHVDISTVFLPSDRIGDDLAWCKDQVGKTIKAAHRRALFLSSGMLWISALSPLMDVLTCA